MRQLLISCVAAALAVGACKDGATPSTPSVAGAPATTTTVPTTTTAPAQRVLRETTFRDANGYQTQGTARIVEAGNEFSLELGDDFRTSQSPALEVRLCSEPNCRSGATLNLGDLKRFSGAQSYPLPDDGNQYSHAVIYCRAVHLAFGFGVLG